MGAPGCGAAAREAARTAAPAAVEEGVQEAGEPESRGDFAKILSDPRILDASEELGRAIATGALDAFSTPEQLEQLGTFSETLAMRVSSALAKSMSEELGPQISRITADAVQQAVERALSVETERRATELTRALTDAVIQGLARAPEVAPGEPALTHDLTADPRAPGSTAQPRLSGIAVLARHAGMGAALGFQDAVRQTELRRAAGRERAGDILALPARLSGLGLGALSLITWLGLAIAIAMVAALIWALLRARRLRRESQAREDAVVLLASVIKSTEGAPWGAELRERIREAARSSNASETLRHVLRKHSGLRFEHRTGPRYTEPPVPSSGGLHPAR